MKNYKADDFTWQIPNIDPATPHNQIPYAELFNAAMERHLVQFWGFTPTKAVSSIIAQQALFERSTDDTGSDHADATRRWLDAGAEFSGKEYRELVPNIPPTL